MLKVAVLFGGRSGEHDVSLCSAASVIAALDRKKYEVIAIGIDRDGKWYVQDSPVIIADNNFGRIMKLEKKGSWLVSHYGEGEKLAVTDISSGRKVLADVVFPVMHGTYCEDGTLQGLLELAMVPYVGAGVAGSAVGMDKDIAKRLLRDGGIDVVPWKTLRRHDWERGREKIVRDTAGAFEFPLFVKPCSTGSSVGVIKVSAEKQLAEAIDSAFSYDTRILIEKGISAREIECAVLGNDDPEASAPGEIVPRHEFYSYEAKYIDPDGAKLIIPADLPGSLADAIRNAAVKGYILLNTSGMARVDFFLDKSTGKFYLNEINTLPGFTGISMYPKLWEYSGLPYGGLLDRLIGLALEKHRERMKIKTEWRS